MQLTRGQRTDFRGETETCFSFAAGLDDFLSRTGPRGSVPATRSVAADDPVLAPIDGISLQDYADLARDAQARGVTDEAGMITLAKERGWDPG